MFRFFSSLSLFLLSLFFIVSWSCTKIDNTTIGADLLPAVDNVNTFDTTLTVVANNFDTAFKECFTIYPEDLHSLGYIKNNPLFGTTKSILYTELKPGTFPFKFPDGRVLDSVVLVLSYRSSYGDTISQQRVTVHEISGTFKPDSVSCKFYDFNTSVLGSAIYAPQYLDDTVKGFRELSTHQLRIKLSDEFGEKLLLQDSSTGFKSDTAFKDFFKGFAISPDENFGGNALSYFSLADTNTKLSVYIRTTTATPDTAVYNFRLTNLTASANYVVRNHNGAEIANHLVPQPDGNEAIYIQTTPGTYAEINIPGLGAIPNKIIHKAALVMDQVYSNSSLDNIFGTPGILYLDMQDTGVSKNYKPIPCDFSVVSGTPDISNFGGFKTIVKDALGNNISRYTFNVSRYVQKIVTNKRINSTLRLRAPDFISNATGYFDDCNVGIPPFNYPLNLPTIGQVKLGGGKNLNYRMKLYIVYSNL